MSYFVCGRSVPCQLFHLLSERRGAGTAQYGTHTHTRTPCMKDSKGGRTDKIERVGMSYEAANREVHLLRLLSSIFRAMTFVCQRSLDVI